MAGHALRAAAARAPRGSPPSPSSRSRGIGATTATFSVVRATLLAPLPFRDPARLVVVWHAYPPSLPRGAVSPPGYDDLIASRLFDDATAYTLR